MHSPSPARAPLVFSRVPPPRWARLPGAHLQSRARPGDHDPALCPDSSRALCSGERGQAGGSPAPPKGPLEPRGVFWAVGALRVEKGNFHRAPAPASALLRAGSSRSAGSGGVSSALSAPQASFHARGTMLEVEGSGERLFESQLPAKRPRLARSRPPRSGSCHRAGCGGKGARRRCGSSSSGGGGCFHHSENARLCMASSADANRPARTRTRPI